MEVVMRKIKMPISLNPNQKSDIIDSEKSIVIVGANGSGKSRIGSWLEFNSEHKKEIHRVSAQKSLSMPKSVSPVSLQKAENLLYYGYYDERNSDQDNWNYKQSQRWGQSPTTFLLNDFDKLLTYLFSENYEKALEYKATAILSQERIEPPITLLDQLRNLWEKVLPHRKLIIQSGNIKTFSSSNPDSQYDANEMSDGERVVFYLIGECLSAPKDCIIIIDEPELHIHKSIQRRLWDEIEKLRSDCLFVFLTHDFDFATTRIGTTIVQLNSFNGTDFDWIQLENVEGISNELLYEILGSRVPILFIEGDLDSYDKEIYSLVYTDFTIKPIGSCEKVISSTKSFRNLSTLHNNKCYGIIDRDYKSIVHIEAYKTDGIYTPQVAEVENLFLLPGVLSEVANLLCVPNPDELINTIKNWVIDEFDKFSKQYATEATSSKINYTLNGFDGKAKNIEELTVKYETLKKDIDVNKLYAEKLAYAKSLVDSKDYEQILQVFNHKFLVNQVGKFFSIKPSVYTSKVKDIIKHGDTNILGAISSYLPNFE